MTGLRITGKDSYLKVINISDETAANLDIKGKIVKFEMLGEKFDVCVKCNNNRYSWLNEKDLEYSTKEAFDKQNSIV